MAAGERARAALQQVLLTGGVAVAGANSVGCTWCGAIGWSVFGSAGDASREKERPARRHITRAGRVLLTVLHKAHVFLLLLIVSPIGFVPRWNRTVYPMASCLT